MEASRYNLRSTRKECHTPVQLQLAMAEGFIMASGGGGGGGGGGMLTLQMPGKCFLNFWTVNQTLTYSS